MTAVFARIQNWLAGEDGQWPGGTLGLILVILLIICAIVFLWINIDVNKR